MSLPKIRSYNIQKVMETKRAIERDPEVQSCIGDAISPEEYENFVHVICNAIPGRILLPPVERTVMYVASDSISEQVISNLAWRIAGNLHLLRKGLPVLPWTHQSEYEWVPMQCVEALPRRFGNGRLAAKVKFRVLAGSACSEIITKQWTHRFMGYLSTTIGFSKSWGDYPFSDIHEFVGLRMYGLLDPTLSKGSPNFDKVKVTNTFEQYNREIMRNRARLGGFQCPANYRHRCFNCPIGYDKCSVGTHPRTYIKHQCVSCDKLAWTDPKCSEQGTCVDCMNSKSLAKRK